MSIDNAESMNSKTWSWIESKLIEFDQSWNNQQRPDIRQFLKSAEAVVDPEISFQDHRDQLLAEIVKIDLEYRCRNGEASRAEEYFKEFPSLVDSHHDEIIEAEIAARHVVGDPPNLDEIKNRFPGQLNRWQKLLDSIDGSTYITESTDTLMDGDMDTASSTDRTNFHLRSGDRLSKYTLERELGRGSFAVVWLANDHQLNRQVAIKLISPSKIHLDKSLGPRLMREARVVALVDHPGIVKVFEVGQDDGLTFIVEQFVDGPPLSKMIREGQIATRMCVEIVRDVAHAAHAAHECGIIHRDIKPGNILVDAALNPRLVDFGLAAFEAQNEITLTRQGDMLGTPAYMSPQQALGQNHRVDCRTDVYSLGAVLYHLLAGQVPFRGTTLSVLNAVVNQPATSLFKSEHKIPRDLETIILRCLEKSPADRFESAAELADDLDRYLDGKPIKARPVNIIERIGKWVKRKPRIAAMLGAGLLFGLVFLLTVWQLQIVSHQKQIADQMKREAETEMVEKTIVAGQLAMERGRMKEAVEHLSIALSDDHSFDIQPVVFLDLVECQLATRDIDSASDSLKGIDLSDAPRELQGRSRVLQAQLSIEHGQPLEDARALFAESLNYPISDALEYYVRAMLAETTREAIAGLKLSLDADPLHHQSHRMISMQLFSLAEFDEAERYLKNSCSLFPNDEDFHLMHAALLAATKREVEAIEIIEGLDLAAADRDTWLTICHRLQQVCSDYSHHYSTSSSSDFTVAAMAEIAKDYMEQIHPEFVARGFYFPPLIANRFTDLVRGLNDFFDGEITEDDLTPVIEQILAVHPESSLCCWLGGKQISRGEIGKAKDAFQLATQSLGFISDTELMSWRGVFATSAALWQRKNDAERQLEDVANSIQQIEKIGGGVESFTAVPSHVRTICIVLIEAMKIGKVDEELVLEWMDRAEDCEAMTPAWLSWSRAVIANSNGRLLDALEQLEAVKKLDPNHEQIPQGQVDGMQTSIENRVEQLISKAPKSN